MTDSVFYSDRVGQGRPRVIEIISTEVWAGMTALIQQRINDGSLARAFPRYDCPDDPGHNTITGTDEKKFFQVLRAHVPRLVEPSAVPDEEKNTEGDDIFADWHSSTVQSDATESLLDPGRTPDTATALDVVEFVALHIDQPTYRSPHSWGFDHTHYSFGEQRRNLDVSDELTPGKAQFQRDIDLLFARNGIAFTLEDDLRVRRLGPPEGRLLISDFRPRTGDSQLDDKLNDAMACFLSRNPVDRQDSLEKLWDAFERIKTLELGTRRLKNRSATQLITYAASGSESFRGLLDEEFDALTSIGNNFTIRHHEHGTYDLPTDTAIDYLFLRLASLIALVLRNTGRMAT